MKSHLTSFSILLFLLLFLSSCNKTEKHFLVDETYRKEVQSQFEKRRQEASNRDSALFSVFDNNMLTLEQKEALEFLYAYMPLCDLANYDGDYFLGQVKSAFEARDYFPWGKTVPDDIFRHFVLVHRVNNEYMDTARQVFFEELKERIKNLSMYEAALEVNHWCHEKVTYRGTDPRTSAPLALVRTSWGRCGEESTFTTTALRAVGIPARQCYTPRWVHTDSNHAWVEVWIDGKWYYLGACEPEPELNVAWFTGPAMRAMMVHTNVYGLYNGPEEKNLETSLYSKINLLSNYADTRIVKVKVVDINNRPVEGAKVQFKVYNYAELYSISDNVTDKEGKTSIISGLGDLFIWANMDNSYGYGKSQPEDQEIVIKLEHNPGKEYEENFVMNVPPEKQVTELSPEKITANTMRLSKEDSIRNSYMNTFATEKDALDLATKENLDKNEVWKYLNMAQGNWKEISNFIIQNKSNPLLFPFLASLQEKDVRDTPAEYLNNHLQTGKEYKIKGQAPKNFIASYILSPRIEWELIQPWRSYFLHKFSQEEQRTARDDVNYIPDFVKKHISINDEENYYNCMLTPQGVYELQMADKRSRNIFFVSLCRSFGIAARIEIATGKPQYYENGNWQDVWFEDKESNKNNLPKAKLAFHNCTKNIIKPVYGVHYSIAYFRDGDFHTLDFSDDPLTEKFPYQLEIDEGYYRLTTGSRANDGSVSIHTKYFELKSNKPHSITIEMPEVEGKLFVRGIIDMNSIVSLSDNSKTTLKNLSNGKGLMLCFIDTGKEPSKHILQDLPKVKESLEEWKGGILLMTPEDKSSTGFDLSGFKGLPVQTSQGIDYNRELLNTTANTLQINFNDNFPLIVYLSNNGGVLYSSSGYRIGIGEDILKTIRLEQDSKNQ